MLQQLLQNEDSLALVLVFGTGAIAVLVFGVGWVIVSLAQIFSAYRLKQLMIERGMTPEEIDQVIRAKCSPDPWPPRKPGKVPVEKDARAFHA